MPQPPITPLEWAEAMAWARAVRASAPRPLFGPGTVDAFHVEPSDLVCSAMDNGPAVNPTAYSGSLGLEIPPIEGADGPKAMCYLGLHVHP